MKLIKQTYEAIDNDHFAFVKPTTISKHAMHIYTSVVISLTFFATVLCEPCTYDQPLCPQIEGTEQELTILPVITDCSKYILCQQGVPIVRPCPPSLVFNSEQKVCDFANRTKCVECEPAEEPSHNR